MARLTDLRVAEAEAAVAARFAEIQRRTDLYLAAVREVYGREPHRRPDFTRDDPLYAQLLELLRQARAAQARDRAA